MNYLKLGFTLYLAVFLGMFSAATAIKFWLEYDANIAVAAAREALQRQTIEMQQQSKHRAERQQKAAREAAIKAQKLARKSELDAQNRRAIQSQLSKTCNDWKSVFAKESSPYNQAMMQDACARL